MVALQAHRRDGADAIAFRTHLIADRQSTNHPLPASTSSNLPLGPDAFRVFVGALEGHAIDITEENYAELSQLCAQFGFNGLTAQQLLMS
jgi:hypothetical protein